MHADVPATVVAEGGGNVRGRRVVGLVGEAVGDVVAELVDGEAVKFRTDKSNKKLQFSSFYSPLPIKLPANLSLKLGRRRSFCGTSRT